MDSFISLFDPGTSDEPGASTFEEDNNNNNEGLGEMIHDLPPEPQLGNIEYKLKLVNPSRQRFEHLVTQVSLIQQ